MDSLLNAISKSMIQKASEACLFHAIMPINSLLKDRTLIKVLEIKEPLSGPIGLMINLNTKNKASLINVAITEVIHQLQHGGAIPDHTMIRELHAARISSFEETVEVFVFAIDDVRDETH